MIQVDDLSRSLIAFEQISTLVIVVELSQSSWLAAGVVPGIERRPLKKLDPDPTALLHLVEGWRDRATKAGRAITRTVLAFETGRDGFWLARWLRVRGVETFVMHSTSVAVSREPRRAKTTVMASKPSPAGSRFPARRNLSAYQHQRALRCMSFGRTLAKSAPSRSETELSPMR
jgi:hypothetical protein